MSLNVFYYLQEGRTRLSCFLLGSSQILFHRHTDLISFTYSYCSLFNVPQKAVLYTSIYKDIILSEFTKN